MHRWLVALVILGAACVASPNISVATDEAPPKLPWSAEEAKKFIQPGMRLNYFWYPVVYTGSGPFIRCPVADVINTDENGYTLEEWRYFHQAPVRRYVRWDAIADRIAAFDTDKLTDRDTRITADGREMTARIWEYQDGKAMQSLVLSPDYPGLILVEEEKLAEVQVPVRHWQQTLTNLLSAKEANRKRDSEWCRSPWTESEAKRFLKPGTSWVYDVEGKFARTVTCSVTSTDENTFTVQTVDGEKTETVARHWKEGTRWIQLNRESTDVESKQVTANGSEYVCKRFKSASNTHYTGARQQTLWAVKDMPLVYAKIERELWGNNGTETWTLKSVTRP